MTDRLTYRDIITIETGEINWANLKVMARSRAIKEWGGTNYPPRYARDAIEWMKGIARAEQRGWRRDRGLPAYSEAERAQFVDMGPRYAASVATDGRIHRR